MVLTGRLSRFGARLPQSASSSSLEVSSTITMPAPVRRQQQRRLTVAECQHAIESYLAGSSMKQLAAEFKVHRVTIAALLRKHNVPPRRQGISSGEIETAAGYYRDGWSLTRIANHYGCSATTARAALMKNGVEIRARHGWMYGGTADTPASSGLE